MRTRSTIARLLDGTRLQPRHVTDFGGMPPSGITTADVDAAFVKRMTERLHSTGFDPEILSALEQFADPMLDELFERIATPETKATN